jgi:uncharacterized membrane protein
MGVPRRLRKYVSEETLDAIARAVREGESKTSGQIVVHIVRNLLPMEDLHTRARRAFFTLGVDRTSRRNGVLLFVVMKKRRFEIVADEGVERVVAGDLWPTIADELSAALAREGFERGICLGVGRVGDVLASKFPRETGSVEADVNELPDRPSVG